MTIIIQDTTVIPEPGVTKAHHDIVIDGPTISAVIPTGTQPMPAGAEVVDGRHHLYTPGLIDTHVHTGQQLLRGRVLDAKPIIWTRIMLPFESRMTPEIMQVSAEVAALEMITSGTTGFVESGSYDMQSAGRVYAQSGLRGALAYSTMDDPTLPASVRMNATEALAHTDALYDEFDHQGNLQVDYALRALNNCSNELIEGAITHSRDRHATLQAHMNEYPAEVQGIVKRTGMRPYVFLNELGGLDHHFLGAHNLFLDPTEKHLIETHPVTLSHSPFSNAGKGVPDTPELLERHIPIGMGTDGAAHGSLSLFNEIKIFRSVMNLWHGVPGHKANIMPATTVFNMIWQGGAAALNQSGQLGRIAPGYQADLIAIDTDTPHLWGSGSWTNTLLEGVNANDVSHSMVAGKWLMKNREVLTMDVERIHHHLNQLYKTLW